MKPTQVSEEVRIPIGGVVLPGELAIPADPHGVILFAHGSGSSRLSPAIATSPSTCRTDTSPRCCSIS